MKKLCLIILLVCSCTINQKPKPKSFMDMTQEERINLICKFL